MGPWYVHIPPKIIIKINQDVGRGGVWNSCVSYMHTGTVRETEGENMNVDMCVHPCPLKRPISHDTT